MRKSDLLVLIQSLQAEVSVLQKRVWDLEHPKTPHMPATSPPIPGWVHPTLSPVHPDFTRPTCTMSTPNGA